MYRTVERETRSGGNTFLIVPLVLKNRVVSNFRARGELSLSHLFVRHIYAFIMFPIFKLIIMYIHIYSVIHILCLSYKYNKFNQLSIYYSLYSSAVDKIN